MSNIIVMFLDSYKWLLHQNSRCHQEGRDFYKAKVQAEGCSRSQEEWLGAKKTSGYITQDHR